ncbi:MAG: Verru_Chthon cassette protein B [Verrucomicrobiales bacterium]|nr:Verru_Chthon cassette protein B [Verrucomicrobiales bacterium]
MKLQIESPDFARSLKVAGFSLIEVTIAMAIAAVAVVTLLGMIPQGMNTMRDAGDEAIMARIHQQVLNELQVADFDALDTYDELEVYFDAQGEELGDNRGSGSQAKGTFEHIYSARVSVLAAGEKLPDSVGGAGFGGYSFDKGGSQSKLLRPVLIEIVAIAGLGNEFDWSDKYSHLIQTYQTTVVKMGQAFSS